VIADDIKRKTASGIEIAYGSDERLEIGARMTGTVAFVGEQCWYDFPDWPNKPWCKIGDKVVWAKYAGKVTIDPYTGQEYIVLNDIDLVVCFWDENDNSQ